VATSSAPSDPSGLPPPASNVPSPSRRGPVARYLTSTKNIVGSTGALAGLALFFTGVVGPLWPAVVVGLYGIGALLAPRERSIDLRSDVDPKDLGRSLERLLKQIHGKVPSEIEGKVQGIATTIQGVLPRTGQLPPGSQELFILQRTVAEYLPTSLESFMNLPRTYAAIHPLKGTKTAQQVLTEQLDLLQEQMNEVADAAAKSDADRLLAQGRFLEDKFGRSDLSIGPGAGGAASASDVDSPG
jgi:hypothetical protein